MPGNSELAIGPLVVVPLSPLAYRRGRGRRIDDAHHVVQIVIDVTRTCVRRGPVDLIIIRDKKGRIERRAHPMIRLTTQPTPTACASGELL